MFLVQIPDTDGSPSYHSRLQQPSSNGRGSTEMEAARLTAQSKEWSNQLFTLYIEHSPEIPALSNRDCPHRRLRPLRSSLAALGELSEMPCFLVENPGQESPWSEKEAGFNLFFWMVLHTRTFLLHPSICSAHSTRLADKEPRSTTKRNWTLCERLWLIYKWSVCLYCGSQEGQHQFNRWRVQATPQHS